MAYSPSGENWNAVSWALSGYYDEDRPILIDAEDPTRSLSRRKVTDLIAELVGSFEERSTVCVNLYNDILYPVIVLAILASGCEWTGTNPAYTSDELLHHFTRSDTRYVITAANYLGVVESAVASSGRDIEVIIFSDITAEKVVCKIDHSISGDVCPKTLHDLVNQRKTSTLRQRLGSISPHAPATVMSTSGTTGLPKMVQRSHRSLILETSGIQDDNGRKPYPVRRLYCTPIFHAFSFPEMVINSLRSGHQSFFMRRFDRTFARKVHDFGITETMAAPAMLLKLVGWTEKDQAERSALQTLRMVLCAGAPLVSHLRTSFLSFFPADHTRLVQVWGMSEGGWFATFKYPEHDNTGSVGRPVCDYQVRVRENSKVRLTDGRTAGELLVKGLPKTTAYKGNTGATRDSFADGWLRTGDIGYIEGGKVYLIDRAKDIIKVNGWTIAPAELEAVLYQMPGILDATALSCGTGTEEHAAIFVVLEDQSITTLDVMRHMLDRVARFKVATCEIHFVTSLPRNPSGKILRNTLRARLESGLHSE